MSTRITYQQIDNAKYPYFFHIRGAAFCLQQAGLKWQLIEYGLKDYPVIATWTRRKPHEAMIGEALTRVLFIMNGRAQLEDGYTPEGQA